MALGLKLTLTKETLRRLEERLSDIRGGMAGRTTDCDTTSDTGNPRCTTIRTTGGDG